MSNKAVSIMLFAGILAVFVAGVVHGEQYSFMDNFDDGVLNPKWNVLQNGCTIEETGGELRVQGTVLESGWGKGNGVQTSAEFPEGDFTAAVDFRVPEFSGSGTRLIYLQAHSWEETIGWEQTVGIFYSYGFGYRVQTWNPGQFSNWLAPFGDEGTTFHRMKLAYDFAAQTVTGYVDDVLVGSLNAQMGGDVSFTIQAATETAGMVIDTRFDNFYCAGEEPPEEPPPQFLTLPFIDPSIQIVQGWRYNAPIGTNPDNPYKHDAIDYIKMDADGNWKPFEVVAVANGKAIYWCTTSSLGNYVMTKHTIDDVTYYTVNAHLESSPLAEGEWVDVYRGLPIGTAGDTGSQGLIHLHFEFFKGPPDLQYKKKSENLEFLDAYDIYSTKADYPPEGTCRPNYYWTRCPPISPDGKVAEIFSPVELRVYDSQGRITGLQNGEEKNEIPNSMYFENTITIALPADTYYYEVAGTGEGTYGLNITSVSEGEAVTFEAIDIPTSPGAVHRYTINWDALSLGEEGVILKIDKNGDGFFEQIVIADNELTYDEVALQTETVVDFDPDTLNLKSEGKFATVYIELPEDFDVSEIDPFSLELNDLIPPLPKPIEIGDYDSDGINDLMVKFDFQEIISLLEPGEQIIDLTGRLWDGRPIAGFDIVRVIH